MAPGKHKALLSGSPEEVEAQFYEALRAGDLQALMAVWADDEEIVCIHPGGMRLVGLAAIRAGFEQVFQHNPIPVQPEQVKAVHWLGGAVHHLVERIEVRHEDGLQTAFLLATNVYLNTPQGWRMVAHHASPGALPERAGEGEDGATLH